MLTKNDLQQIREVVHEAIQEETPKIVKEELLPITSNIKILQRDVTSVKKKLNKVSKDVDTLIPYFDKRLTSLEKDMRDVRQN